MSLEATIQENTAAIRELIAAIQAGVPTTAAQVSAVVDQVKAEPEKAAPKATSEKTEKGASEKKPVAETASSQSGATQKSADPQGGAQGTDKKDNAVTYQDAAAAVTKLAKVKSRDAAVAVLEKFGAKKLPDIKPDQFADVIRACEEAEAVEA